MKIRNAEAVVIAALKAQPAITVDVATRVPNPRPASFIRVNRIGGVQINMVQERPIILIECWGATETAAWLLCMTAHEALEGRDPLEVNGVELMDREVTSPVNYPDPSTSSPRYQFQLQTTINMEGSTS